MSQGYILVLVSLIYPTGKSMYVLETSQATNERAKALIYWVVFSLVSFIHGIIPYIPFASRMLQSIPYNHELLFIFFLWLQLPWTDGSSVVYRFIIPIVNRYMNRLPKPSLPGDNEKRNLVMRLIIDYFVPAKYRGNVLDILLHGGTIVFGIIFFFTPSFLTGLGCLLVGIVFPYYASMSVLGQEALISSKAVSDQAEELEAYHKLKLELCDKMLWWIQYWIVYFTFSFLFDAMTTAFNLDAIPLWYHGKLATIMWLQLPMTRGAEALNKHISAMVTSMSRIFSLGVGGVSAGGSVQSPRNRS